MWVTRSLAVGDWTAIREIAVEYDAALVVTTNRATPQSPPNADSFTIWSASLTDHSFAPLIRGVNLRWLDWMRFADDAPYELAALYDDCSDCVANTFFTAFHYDVKTHNWQARWIRNGQGVPMYSANTPPNVDWIAGLRSVCRGQRPRIHRHVEPLRLRQQETVRRFHLPIRSGSHQRPRSHAAT